MGPSSERPRRAVSLLRPCQETPRRRSLRNREAGSRQRDACSKATDHPPPGAHGGWRVGHLTPAPPAPPPPLAPPPRLSCSESQTSRRFVSKHVHRQLQEQGLPLPARHHGSCVLRDGVQPSRAQESLAQGRPRGRWRRRGHAGPAPRGQVAGPPVPGTGQSMAVPRARGQRESHKQA